ncbi:MAG: four helix bundle protein [Thermoflexales bacterium]
MATIRRFEDIEAWQTARELTRLVYQLSDRTGFARDFGLKDQMRRAAVSVMSNIAEGYESRTTRLFVEFLGRAKGSCGEVRAQSYVALDAGYVSREEFSQLYDAADKCIRQIANLMAYLERTNDHANLTTHKHASKHANV